MENENVVAENEVEFEDVLITDENNTGEAANPQAQEEVKTDVQSELAEPVKSEPTETQRVSQRIKEATEKARQEAKDEVIAEMGYVWKGKPIKTESEYKIALKEQEYKTELEAKGLPEEVIEELIESRKFREKYSAKEKEEQEKTEQEQKKTKECNEFFDFYKEKYGKDVVVSELPKEVIELSNIMPIKSAFIQHEYERLLKGQVVEKKNEENAQTTTGSVSGQGSSQELIFTPENVANMTEKEMSKHWYNPLFRKAAGLSQLKK